MHNEVHSDRTPELPDGYSMKMTPERIWLTSIQVHRKGMHRTARVLKAINAIVYSTSLPPEAVVGDDIYLWHHGLGLVIHPDTKIGRGVHIAHGVTIAAGAPHADSGLGVVVEDGVTIGAGACIIPKEGFGLTLGKGCVIGANAVVTRDVPPFAVAVGQPAVVRERTPRVHRLPPTDGS
jgi:serine O-acetyltransferase